jgi:hypothetical protein
MTALFMRKSKHIVFIGVFPSRYRAEVVASRLDWSGCWNTMFTNVIIQENAKEDIIESLTHKHFAQAVEK